MATVRRYTLRGPDGYCRTFRSKGQLQEAMRKCGADENFAVTEETYKPDGDVLWITTKKYAVPTRRKSNAGKK